jgi:hypothetical protein
LRNVPVFIPFAAGLIMSLLWLAPEAGVAGESQNQIRVTTSKNKLLLGVEKTLEITMHLPRNSDLHKFNFQALHGSISDVEVVPNKRKVRARYTAPEQFFPAVELIVVSASDGATTYWGFDTIKLIGQGKARIETTPNATTFLRIGSRRFGPTTADETGEAVVDVEVPPGVTYGIDDEGNEVPLHLPKGTRAAVFAAHGPQINRDETENEDLLFVLWNPDGEMDTVMQSPLLTVTGGEVSGIQKVSDGVFRAFYRVHTEPGPVVFNIYDDAHQLLQTQTIELVGKEDFSETAVIVEDQKEEKKEVRPPSVKKKAPPPALPGEYQMFLSAVGGVNTDFGDWLAPVVKVGFDFRLPARPLLGVGIRLGAQVDTQKDDLRSAGQQTQVSSTTYVFPATVHFSYRMPFRTMWYLTPGIDIGLAVVYSSQKMTGFPRQKESRPQFAAAASISAERVLGPGMLVGQLNVTYLHSALTIIDGSLFSVEGLVGYRFAFGNPRR